MLNKEILEFVMPDPVDKELIESFKSNRDKSIISKDNYFLSLFYEEYLKFTLKQGTKIDNENINEFQRILDEISKESIRINLGYKINDFLILAHMNNVISLLDFDSNSRFQKDKKDIDFRNLAKIFYQKHHIDVSSLDISNNKYTYLNLIKTHLNSDTLYALDKNGINSSGIVKYIRNSLLNVNNLLFKMKQFDFKEEINFGQYIKEVNIFLTIFKKKLYQRNLK